MPINHLTYNTGPRGSHRLRRALASFWTEEFRPILPLTIDNVFITSGLAGALDSLAWAVCDEGDGILIPLPLYNGFKVDLLNRSNVHVVGIPYRGIEGYLNLNDLFRADVNLRAMEAALNKAHNDGIRIRALMISQ